MHGDHDLGAKQNHNFERGLPPVRLKVHGPEDRNCRHQHDPQSREQAERQRRARPLHLEARLDLRFESVEVIVNLSPGGVAQLAIHAVEIRRDHESRRQSQHANGIEKNFDHLSQPQRAPQTPLAAVHLAAVGFVIVAHQVKHAMKNQDAHLLAERPPEAARVPPRDRRSDRDVSEIGGRRGRGSRGHEPVTVSRRSPMLPRRPLPLLLRIRRKRQHVGRSASCRDTFDSTARFRNW